MTDNPATGRGLRSGVLKFHRWLGLIAMAWLIVLGATGVVLDHPEWRWTKQWTLTEAFASPHVLDDEARGTVLRQFQVNPDDISRWIAGGERGLWRSEDAGSTWSPVEYADTDGIPQLFAIVPQPDRPWARIFLATDDGIWLVDGERGMARRFALAAQPVTQLVVNGDATELVGVIDARRIFSMSIMDPDAIRWTDLANAAITNPPAEIGLGRLATDLHFGNGAARGSLSTWISDYGGIAIVLLSLTGLLQWWLPRRWRRGKKRLKADSRRDLYRWVFRSHGPLVGLLAVIPILLLSLSGIFFDHPRELMRMTSDVRFSSAVLPTAFRPRDLAGEIRALSVAPDGRWSVMTRLGLLHSDDGGTMWSFDYQAPLLSHLKGGLVGMSQHDDVTFIGMHGGPNFYRGHGELEWQQIPGLRMMIQDAERIGEQWYMKGSRGFIRGTLDGRFEPLDAKLPDITGLPVYNFLVDLHTGLMFHDQWIWVNDIAAIIAIILAITGLVNWLYRRWI